MKHTKSEGKRQALSTQMY